MGELAKKDEPVIRSLMPRDHAVAFFKGIGEHYKAEIIASIPSNEDISSMPKAGSPTCAAGRTCRPPASSRCSS